MSQPTVSTFRDEYYRETNPNTDAPAPGQAVKAAKVEDDKAKALEANLTATERQALKVFSEARKRQEEEAEEDLQNRIQDESLVIQQAARNLTGLALTSDPVERRFLVAHHLREFFAAIAMPPGLDAPSRQALRQEALTMLLKLGPQDDIERMLLIQLIASYIASTTCFSRAAAPEASPEIAAQALSQAQKMSRLFLDIERAFRQRRKQLGQPERHDTKLDPKDLARRIIFMLAERGVFFDDKDASP